MARKPKLSAAAARERELVRTVLRNLGRTRKPLVHEGREAPASVLRFGAHYSLLVLEIAWDAVDELREPKPRRPRRGRRRLP